MRESKPNLLRKSKSILYTVAIGLGALALWAFLNSIFQWKLPSTSFQVYYWESSHSVLAGMLGVFLFLLERMLARYRFQAPPRTREFFISRGLQGLALALLIILFQGTALHRPVTVNWMKFKVEASATPELQHEGHSHNKVDLLSRDRQARALAAKKGLPVLYYFHADWCHNCPDFERYRLQSPILKNELKKFLLVKMDVTDMEHWSAYIQKNFKVMGTPSLAFRTREGRVLTGATITGTSISLGSLRALLKEIAENPVAN